MGTYSDTFKSIFRYFLRVIFKVTYVALVNYGFITLHINYSHLILKLVTYIYFNNHFLTPRQLALLILLCIYLLAFGTDS